MSESNMRLSQALVHIDNQQQAIDQLIKRLALWAIKDELLKPGGQYSLQEIMLVCDAHLGIEDEEAGDGKPAN